MVQAIAIFIAVGLSGVACSKDKKKEPIVVGGRLNSLQPPPPVPQEGTETPEGEGEQQAPASNGGGGSMAEFIDAGPATVVVTQTIGGSAGTPGVAADPDLAVVVAARTQAAGCFSRLAPHDVNTAPPSRSASFTVTVVPTGRVTRTEVRASGPRGGAAEPELTECLKHVGDGLTFTPKDPPKAALTGGKTPSALGGDLRSFTIDVTVSSKH